MEPISFTNKFKNKLSKIGKEGEIHINPGNNVKKITVPEKKMHLMPNIYSSSSIHNYRDVTSDSKALVITGRIEKNTTPNKIPQIKNVFSRDSSAIILRNKSPFITKVIRKGTDCQLDNVSSCIKLPSIDPKTKNFLLKFNDRLKSYKIV